MARKSQEGEERRGLKLTVFGINHTNIHRTNNKGEGKKLTLEGGKFGIVPTFISGIGHLYAVERGGRKKKEGDLRTYYGKKHVLR